MLEVERSVFGRGRGSFSLLYLDLEIPRNDRMLAIIRTVVGLLRVVGKNFFDGIARKVLYMEFKAKAEYKQ